MTIWAWNGSATSTSQRIRNWSTESSVISGRPVHIAPRPTPGGETVSSLLQVSRARIREHIRAELLRALLAGPVLAYTSQVCRLRPRHIAIGARTRRADLLAVHPPCGSPAVLRLRQPRTCAIFDPHRPRMEDKEVRPAEIADFNQYTTCAMGSDREGNALTTTLKGKSPRSGL
jgi:hypothetical protein